MILANLRVPSPQISASKAIKAAAITMESPIIHCIRKAYSFQPNFLFNLRSILFLQSVNIKSINTINNEAITIITIGNIYLIGNPINIWCKNF